MTSDRTSDRTTDGTPVLPVALVGMGKMGRAIDALAIERRCEVVARLGADEMDSMTREALGGARVAIEFTRPEAALSNARTLLALGCPIVVGTTGWTAHLADLEAAVRETGTPALWAPNFSVGVQLFLAFAEDAARRLREVDGFDTHVVETHHTAKKDAPSGTGIAIAERLAAGLGHQVPVSSVRVGSVPGTHEVIFDAPFEQIKLVHEARDRRVFADGALTAARWLSRQTTPALYTMRDVLRATPST
ncbi:MAG TPA: dihydrodipicolinate reductase C-terminal domain-containing protein [Gemmatimonas sp.]|uniref:4-hydroxy-tetrahydrodipicolinate reductase n=1 Tax=Gemmatimonas sp. TaxID=1962908 RepID=UPI002ED8546E